MKQEDKELLLKDLCGRLPYGVKVQTPVMNDEITLTCGDISAYFFNPENKVFPKPYLRPMSSMTVEERDRLRSLDGFIQCDMLYNIVEGDFEVFDYLNSIHVSYRTFNGNDMFELGLALEAPKDMYNLKEK